MLNLKNLIVKVGDKIIIDRFNFCFEKNKVYALMGPNGSGKSTLAYTIAGHPEYKAAKGKIIFKNEDITNDSPDQRAKRGIFLSFQTPPSLNGVSLFQFLRLALSGKKDPYTLKKDLDKLAKKLKIKPELLARSLNEGASGGEKKKIELIQAIMLEPSFMIFDEIDTGVDVDALKIIAKFLEGFKKSKTIVLITHYNRILKYVKPDEVLVINQGKLKYRGDYKLAWEIEKNGYEKSRS